MRTQIVEGVEGARSATGTVVVIDVLRAFTTAAYAFAAGIAEVELVTSVEEALAAPGYRMGEVGGRLIPGFDHNNSPSQLRGKRLSGRAVMRTGSGTRCAVAATGADELWLGSLVVARATVSALRGRESVTFVASGRPHEGEEDIICAEWMTSLLRGGSRSPCEVIEGVRGSRAAAKHLGGDSDLPPEDIECATALDVFDFAIRADRNNGSLIAKPCSPPDAAGQGFGK